MKVLLIICLLFGVFSPVELFSLDEQEEDKGGTLFVVLERLAESGIIDYKEGPAICTDDYLWFIRSPESIQINWSDITDILEVTKENKTEKGIRIIEISTNKSERWRILVKEDYRWDPLLDVAERGKKNDRFIQSVINAYTKSGSNGRVQIAAPDSHSSETEKSVSEIDRLLSGKEKIITHISYYPLYLEGRNHDGKLSNLGRLYITNFGIIFKRETVFGYRADYAGQPVILIKWKEIRKISRPLMSDVNVLLKTNDPVCKYEIIAPQNYKLTGNDFIKNIRKWHKYYSIQ